MHVIFYGTEDAAPTYHLKVTEEGAEFISMYHGKSKGIF